MIKQDIQLEGEKVGGVRFGATKDGSLLLLFDEPVSWLLFTPDEARAFARKMANSADVVEQGSAQT